MTLQEICNLINGEIIVGKEELAQEIKIVFVSDMMSDVLAFSTPGALLITGNNKIQAVRTAIVAEMSSIILVRSKTPDAEMINVAQQNILPIIVTSLDTFEVCGKIYNRLNLS